MRIFVVASDPRDYEVLARCGADRLRNEWICEDVKGVRTAVFNVKWKLAMARYPNVDFRIVQM